MSGDPVAAPASPSLMEVWLSQAAQSLSSPQIALQLTVNLGVLLAVWWLGSSLLRRARFGWNIGALRYLRWVWNVSLGYALLAVLAFRLQLFDLSPLWGHGGALLTWGRESAVRLLAILAVSAFAWQLVGLAARRIVPGEDFNRASVRTRTLTGVVESTLRVVIIALAGMFALQNFGLDATALLAGAGVVGLAVGFGAQSLVKDVFSGFFILLEDQYGVGDIVKVNQGLSGTVERLNLRVTVLRDLDGTVHVIPNGQINTVSVASKDWSRVVALVSVDYGANVNEAIGVLEGVCMGLYADSQWNGSFLEAPDIQGVTALEADGVQLRALFTVRPKSQYPLGREFNRRIKIALDAAGIEIPFPQRTLSVQGTLPVQLVSPQRAGDPREAQRTDDPGLPPPSAVRDEPGSPETGER